MLRPQGNPNWIKGGPSPNPNGRPRGKPIGDKIQERTEDPLLTMAEFVAETSGPDTRNSVQILLDFARCEKMQPSLRIAAASAAAPYQFAKKSHQLTRVSTPIDVPDFQSVEEAEDFVKVLMQRVGQGELDFQSTNELSTRIQTWINSKRAGVDLDIKRLAHGDMTGDQIIKIEGGLPPLPGTTMTMPSINGHNGNRPGHELPPQPTAIEATTTDVQECSCGPVCNYEPRPTVAPPESQAADPSPETQAKGP